MKKYLKFILLVCAAMAIFALGAIFSYYIRPNRYEFGRGPLVKFDTITGRVWRYDSDRDAFVEIPTKQRSVFENLLK